MNQPSSSGENQDLNITDASVEGQLSQAGRDSIQYQAQGDIHVHHYPRQEGKVSPPLSRRGYLNRQVLLNKVYNYWICGVLEKSLFNEVQFELGLEERLDLIELVWETPERFRQILKQGVKAINKFDELGAGRTLLLLGASGSGKTTTLLEMARDLIERTKQDENLPIPIVLNLSSWTQKKRQFVNWLAQELETGIYKVNHNVSKAWIQNEQLLLLLDGLDEVREDLRDSCVDAINKFSQEYGQTEIIVCSRIQEYESLDQSLRFQGALFIQPLKLEQILSYLEQAGEEFAGINAALKTDPVLQELAQTPLMLSVMALAYKGMPASTFPKMTFQERQRHLWGTYIDRALSRKQDRSGYLPNMTLNWLGFLAQRLIQESQTPFLIEQIKPSWLKSKLERRAYPILVGIITGLTIEWLYGLPMGLIAGMLSFHMLFGLLTGFALGTFGSLGSEIQLFTAIGRSWSWEKAWKALIPGLLSGPLIGGLIWFFGKPLGIVSGSFEYFLSLSSTTGLIIVIINMLFAGLVSSDLTGSLQTAEDSLIKPNQGIWQTAHRTATTTFIVLSTIILPMAIFGRRFIPLSALLGCISLYAGGLACIQHITIRSLLAIGGNSPWNYAKFLNNSVNQVFLERAGSSYQFFHDLLRRAIATNYTQKSQESIQGFSRLISVLLSFALVIGLISLTFPIALNTWKVVSISPIFTPRLNQGDRLLVDRISHHFWELQRGDIISFTPTEAMIKSGFNYSTDFKQVLGLPGEEINIIEDMVYVNGDLLRNESLVIHPAIRNHGLVKVPEEMYLVIVNNPNYYDERDMFLINLIPKENIDSRVLFRFWPLQAIGSVNW